MSGIVGMYQLNGRPANTELLKQMLGLLAHRGPDAVGNWHDDAIALGHCMLYTTPESLLDMQPLQDKVGDAVITFDGRIDNRAELRELLLSKGIAVQTGSDTEIVLMSYRCWGEGCTEKILGDFAFAIWDGRKRLLFCARDPMGVKPFYYYFDGKKFLFCSEIQPLFKDTAIGIEPNQPLVKQYMKGDFFDRTATLYRDIYKIPSAHYMVVDGSGNIRTKRYWDFCPKTPIRYKTTREYTDHFLDLFQEAVKCRLRAIGPVGTLLSGGLDSSSVVCTGKLLAGKGLDSAGKLETFSAVSNTLTSPVAGEFFDERDYIQSVLRMYDLESNYFFYEDQKPVGIMETSRYYRDVFYSPAFSFLTPILEGASRKGIRVLLDGLGGDDILGSEPELYLYRYADLIKQLKITELLHDLGLALKYYPFLKVIGLFLKFGIYPLIGSLPKTLLRLRPQLSRYESAITEPRFFSIFQERIYQYLIQGWNTNAAIEDHDRFCSYHTIEPRYPFLDIRLVNFVLAVPPEQLSRKYQTKLILRRAMKGILPEMVRRRTTKGSFFPVVNREIKVVRKEEVYQLLESPTLSEGVDWPYIRRIFAKYCEDKVPVIEDIRKVVIAASMEAWHRTVIESNTLTKGG